MRHRGDATKNKNGIIKLKSEIQKAKVKEELPSQNHSNHFNNRS